MGVPATTGQLRTRIADMEIGDYMKWYVSTNANSAPTIAIDDSVTNEIPLTGISQDYGFFYMIKVDKGLLIADRVVQHSVSWDVLNNANYIQGVNVVRNSVSGIIRSLGGGNSYLDENGNSTTTNNQLGAFPSNNEFDEYINKKIYNSEVSNSVIFNSGSNFTLTQDTPSISMGVSTNRIRRSVTNVSSSSATSTSSLVGFRPVFEYQEVNL